MNSMRWFHFISAINKRDYLKVQEKLFEGMTVEDIYKKAQIHLKKRRAIKG